MEKIYQVKRNLAKRRPKFNRQDSHKKKKVGLGWRRPKGLQSKMRLEKKGYSRVLKVGFRSPRKTRDRTLDGLRLVTVTNVRELATLDNACCIIISSSVGLKNKLAICGKAIEKNIKINNIKDPKAFIEEKKHELSNKKEEKNKKLETRKEKKEKKSKDKSKKKKTIDEKVSGKKEDDKKAAETKKETPIKETKEDDEKMKAKKEQDKILTKKDGM